MHAFPGIFLHVDVVDAHRFGLAAYANFQLATDANGLPVLRNLIAFRQIGIEIIFAIEGIARIDATAQSESEPDGKRHLLPVEHGQSARMPQRYGADMGIGVAAERGIVATKRLTVRGELNVYLQADDGFVRCCCCGHSMYFKIRNSRKCRNNY